MHSQCGWDAGLDTERRKTINSVFTLDSSSRTDTPATDVRRAGRSEANNLPALRAPFALGMSMVVEQLMCENTDGAELSVLPVYRLPEHSS